METLLTLIVCISLTAQSIVSAAGDQAIPKEAYERAGVWVAGNLYIATGQSRSVDAPSKAKGVNAAKRLAEEDCESRILHEFAKRNLNGFDQTIYETEGEISGLECVTSYSDSETGVYFFVGKVVKSQIKARLKFSRDKACRYALERFEKSDYLAVEAIESKFAAHAISDPAIGSLAQASRWHLALQTTTDAATLAQSHSGLGDFYFRRQQYEESLKHFYNLYESSSKPDSVLYERLGDLCELTHRPDNAAQFRALAAKHLSPPVLDYVVDEPFGTFIQKDQRLLTSPGARVITIDGQACFVAVGTADIRNNTDNDIVRRITVARAKAQKEAASFTNPTHIITKSVLTDKTVIIRSTDDAPSTVMSKELHELVIAETQGVLDSMKDIGSWRSADGAMFFFAIGRTIPIHIDAAEGGRNHE